MSIFNVLALQANRQFDLLLLNLTIPFDKLLGRSFRRAEQQSSDKASKLLMEIIHPLHFLKTFCREALTARLQSGDFNGMLDSANWDQIEDATSAIETALGEGKPDKYTELIGKYQTARQFAPLIIKGFSFGGTASAASLLRAVDLLRIMSDANKRSLPDNPPTGFIRKVWRPFVFPAPGAINRKAYALCAFFELRDRLRAGDVWVEGSRQRRNFDDRLIPKTVNIDPFDDVKIVFWQGASRRPMWCIGQEMQRCPGGDFLTPKAGFTWTLGLSQQRYARSHRI